MVVQLSSFWFPGIKTSSTAILEWNESNSAVVNLVLLFSPIEQFFKGVNLVALFSPFTGSPIEHTLVEERMRAMAPFLQFYSNSVIFDPRIKKQAPQSILQSSYRRQRRIPWW